MIAKQNFFKINNKAYHKTNIKNLIRSLNYS